MSAVADKELSIEEELSACCLSFVSKSSKRSSMDEIREKMASWQRRGMGIAPEVPEEIDTLWKFLSSGAVYTIDEVRQLARPLPCGADELTRERYAYMQPLMNDYSREHKIWFCEKSRRMMITWLLCASYLYRVMTQPHSNFFIGSRNFDKSCFLLGPSRIQGIYKNIPASIWPDKPKVEFHYKNGTGFEHLYCPETDSYIHAMWEGAEQLREFTVTGAWFDEFAFWRFAPQLWRGAIPTISGGARVDVTTTPKMGAFAYRLLYRGDDLQLVNRGDRKSDEERLRDQMRDAGVFGTNDYVARELCQGLEVRDTLTGIHAVRLHYTADPFKRTEEWREAERVGLSEEDWRQEYEIDWMSGGGGQPIYGGFDETLHVSKSSISVSPSVGGTWIRGWDFGNQPACVVCWLSPTTQLNVLDCFATWDGLTTAKSSNITELAPKVNAYCNVRWPGVHWIDYVDSAGYAKGPTDGKSCIDYMNQFGIHDIRPGPMTFADRQQAMNRTLEHKMPKLLINCDCDMIKQAFRGGYRWREQGKGTGRISEWVLKNAWSHPMNGLEYVVGGIFNVTPAPYENEPEPVWEYDPQRVSGAFY